MLRETWKTQSAFSDSKPKHEKEKQGGKTQESKTRKNSNRGMWNKQGGGWKITFLSVFLCGQPIRSVAKLSQLVSGTWLSPVFSLLCHISQRMSILEEGILCF